MDEPSACADSDGEWFSEDEGMDDCHRQAPPLITDELELKFGRATIVLNRDLFFKWCVSDSQFGGERDFERLTTANIRRLRTVHRNYSNILGRSHDMLHHVARAALEIAQDRIDLLGAFEPALLCGFLFGPHLLVLDHVLLEDLNRGGHFADLVFTVLTRHANSQIAMGKLVHHASDAAHRSGNATGESDR